MRKTVLIIFGTLLAFVLLCFILFNLLVIKDTRPDECLVKQIKITAVEAGSDFDIFFTADTGQRYYINRGL